MPVQSPRQAETPSSYPGTPIRAALIPWALGATEPPSEDLEALGLPRNVRRSLRDHQIATVAQLLDHTPAEVLAIRGVGPHGLELITLALERIGLELKRPR